MRNHLILAILFILLATEAFSQTTTESTGSLSFLKLSGTTEGAALGDIHVQGLRPVDQLRTNAAAVRAVGTHVGVAYTMLPTQGNIDYIAAYSQSDSGFLIGINALILRNGELELRTSPTDDPDGVSTPQNSSLAVTTAFDLFDNVRFSLAAKWLNEKIVTYNADGYAFDLGLSIDSVYGFTIGAALQDLGKMGALKSESSSLSSRFTITAATEPDFLRFSDFSSSILGSFQAPLTDGVSHLAVGIEERYKDLLALDLGYLTNNETRGLTVGARLEYSSFALAYTFAPSMNGFNTTNSFGIAVKL